MAVQFPTVKRNNVAAAQSVGRSTLNPNALMDAQNKQVDIIGDAAVKQVDALGKYMDATAKMDAQSQFNEFSVKAEEIKTSFSSVPNGVNPESYLKESKEKLIKLQEEYTNNDKIGSLTKSYLTTKIADAQSTMAKQFIGINAIKDTAYRQKTTDDTIINETNNLTEIMGAHSTEGREQIKKSIGQLVTTATSSLNPDIAKADKTVAKSVENAILNKLVVGDIEGAKSILEEGDQIKIGDTPVTTSIKATTLAKIRDAEINRDISGITVGVERGSMTLNQARDKFDTMFKNDPVNLSKAYKSLNSTDSRMTAQENRTKRKTFQFYYNQIADARQADPSLTFSDIENNPKYSSIKSLSPAMQRQIKAAADGTEFRASSEDISILKGYRRDSSALAYMSEETFHNEVLPKYNSGDQKDLINYRNDAIAISKGETPSASIEKILVNRIEDSIKNKYGSNSKTYKALVDNDTAIANYARQVKQQLSASGKTANEEEIAKMTQFFLNNVSTPWFGEAKYNGPRSIAPSTQMQQQRQSAPSNSTDKQSDARERLKKAGF